MSTMRRPSTSAAARARGFTLVELMVGLALGLLVLATTAVAFLNVSSSRREMEKMNGQMENGRYATQLLMDDIALAGYWGEFNPNVLPAPANIEPCTTDPVDLKLQLPLHIQAYDYTPTPPSCVSDVKPNTRIIVVRRAATCAAGSGTGDCAAAVGGTTYIQSALCNTELALPTIAQRYVVSSTLADFTLHKRGCAAGADIRKYVVHIYFVANNNNPSDGIPTLKRAELGAGSFSVQPLVEGIDNLQAEYALDSDGNGTPNSYTANPATNELASVVGVKLYVLARNTEPTPGYSDAKQYPLGPYAVGPLLDQYKRHEYSALVRVANVAGRRE